MSGRLWKVLEAGPTWALHPLQAYSVSFSSRGVGCLTWKLRDPRARVPRDRK